MRAFTTSSHAVSLCCGLLPTLPVAAAHVTMQLDAAANAAMPPHKSPAHLSLLQRTTSTVQRPADLLVEMLLESAVGHPNLV